MGNGEQCWLASEVSDDKAGMFTCFDFQCNECFCFKGFGEMQEKRLKFLDMGKRLFELF